MVGPVVSIGTPGTSRYRVDYGPIIADRAMALQGIDRIFGGIKEFADRRNTATLSEMLAAKADHDELVDFASKRGLLPQLGEMLTTRRALVPPKPDTATGRDKVLRYMGGERHGQPVFTGPDGQPLPASETKDKGFTLGEGQIRYDAAGNVVARGPDKPAPKVEFKDAMRLGEAWRKNTATEREMTRQRDLMRIGLQQAEAGDMAAGSQAVLVTFQKILDPTSVVRESEYARSASGLSLIEQAEGAFERLKKGGAGLTVDQLKSFVRLADEAVEKLTGGLRGERSRIERFADHYNIPRDLIFSGRLGAAPGPAPGPRQYMTGGGADAVMQSLGLAPPAAPATPQPPPAPASGLDLPTGAGADAGRFATMDLAGLKAVKNPAGLGDADYAAYLARLNEIAAGR